MKRFKLITVFLLVSMSFISVNKAKAQAVQVNISMFQNELSPYGRWFNIPRFGQVWVYDDPAFRPYATDIGIIPITAGRGYLILIGAGHLFIMAAGNTILFMAGCGYPATNGHLHGLAGASMMVTMDGLH